MSHLGMKILYHTINKRRDDAWCERVFSPWVDMAGPDARNASIYRCFRSEARTPVREFRSCWA